jgi:glucose-6-phosphate 1-epimerase
MAEPTASALPKSVQLERGPGGLPRLAINTELASAVIYLHGAHVASWWPHGDRPVLWLSRGSEYAADRPIRGGIPICFPWFGPHRHDRTAPSHGFARVSEWILHSAGEAPDGNLVVDLMLSSDHPLTPAWPHAFEVHCRIVVGATLGLSLDVRNSDSEPFTYESAFHTYFSVSDVRAVAVGGLENTEYLDKTAGFARRQQGSDPLRFRSETDRVYVNTTHTCVLHDPDWQRDIVIDKGGSTTTVVWTPWSEKARLLPDIADGDWNGMLCIETCNVHDDAVTLLPGERHVTGAAIRVAHIP